MTEAMKASSALRVTPIPRPVQEFGTKTQPSSFSPAKAMFADLTNGQNILLAAPTIWIRIIRG